MAWTAPKTWVFEEVPSYTDFNTEFRDNLTYLKDLFNISTGHDHAGGTDDGTPIAPGGLAASAVAGSNVSACAITNPAVGGCAITNPEIGDNAIDDRTAGSRIIQLHRRQGGSAAGWSYPGSTTQVPDTIRMQVGSHQWTSGDGNVGSGSFTVNYPVGFGGTPLIFLNAFSGSSVSLSCFGIGTTAFSGQWIRTNGSVSSIDIHWLAIGPE